MTYAEWSSLVDNLFPDNVVGGISASDARTALKQLGQALYNEIDDVDEEVNGPRQIWLLPATGLPAQENSDAIYHNGSVAIGKTTPTEKLDVQGNITLSGIIKLLTTGRLVSGGGISDANTSVEVNHRYFSATGNVSGLSPNIPYGIVIGWNRSGGLAEVNIIWSTKDWPNSDLVLETWNGTTFTERARLTGANGDLGLNTFPTSKLHVKGATGHQQLRLETSYTPTGTADANGQTGQISWDTNYFYVKTASGWKRSALSTF